MIYLVCIGTIILHLVIWGCLFWRFDTQKLDARYAGCKAIEDLVLSRAEKHSKEAYKLVLEFLR